jgi:hypothetical protein
MNEQAPGTSPPQTRSVSPLVAAAGTALAAIVGAVVAWFVKVPLPWLLGPLFATALVGLLGAPIRPIRYGRTVGQVVIGGAIGVQFTTAILLALLSLLPLMAGVAVVSIVVGAVGALLLMWLGHVDKTTAFFATIPGGVAEMVNLAPRYGAELEPIMVAQTLRVGLIVAVAPFLVVQVAQGATTTVALASDIPWPVVIPLLAASTIAGALLAYFTFPNAWFLGAIAAGMLFASLGFADGRMPKEVLIPAQVLIGAALGVQFRREFVTRLLRLLLASSVVVAFLSIVMALIAVGVAVAFAMPVPTLVLAFAPAGMAEMVLTAKLLGLDGTVVAGFQLVRIVLILILCRPAYWLFAKLVK